MIDKKELKKMQEKKKTELKKPLKKADEKVMNLEQTTSDWKLEITSDWKLEAEIAILKNQYKIAMNENERLQWMLNEIEYQKEKKNSLQQEWLTVTPSISWEPWLLNFVHFFWHCLINIKTPWTYWLSLSPEIVEWIKLNGKSVNMWVQWAGEFMTNEFKKSLENWK